MAQSEGTHVDSKDADLIAPAYPSYHSAETGGIPKARDIAEGDVVTTEERRDLRRGLAQRHVSMIALAGESVSHRLR